MERILGICLGDVATDIFHNITKCRFHLLGFGVLVFFLPAADDNFTATLMRAVWVEVACQVDWLITLQSDEREPKALICKNSGKNWNIPDF